MQNQRSIELVKFRLVQGVGREAFVMNARATEAV